MNNLIKKLGFIVMSGLVSIPVFAGGTVGNGGDVVYYVQKPGSPSVGTPVEVFDVYEARALRGLNLNLGDASLTVKEKVELAIHRLTNPNLYSPGMAALLKNYADNFWTDSILVSGSNLIDIPDTNAISLPKDYEIRQIVIQIKNPSAFDKRYIIDRDLWNMLDTDNQAALVLHEIVYRVAIEQGATNSVGARLINSLIFSDEISKFDWMKWINAWEVAHFTSFIIGDLQIKMSLDSKTPLLRDPSGFVTGTVLQGDKCISSIDQKETNCLKLGSDELIGNLNTTNQFKYSLTGDNTFFGDWSELYLGDDSSKFRISKAAPDLSDILNGSLGSGLILPFFRGIVVYKQNLTCIQLYNSTGKDSFKALIELADGTSYKTKFITPEIYCFDSKGNLVK